MGTVTAPTMELTRSPTMDENPPTCHHQGGTNQQHSICQTISRYGHTPVNMVLGATVTMT